MQKITVSIMVSDREADTVREILSENLGAMTGVVTWQFAGESL